MPRRLRVAFPGGSTQAPITLQAGTGFFTRSGQAANLSKYSPPPATTSRGTWVQLGVSYGTTAGNLDWFNFAHDVARDCVYAVTWYATLVKCSLETGLYTIVGSMEPSIASPSATLPGTHNRGAIYDPINDRFWFANGTGSGTTNAPITGYGTSYWSFTTAPIGPARAFNNGPGVECAYKYDPTGQRIVAWGGWNPESLQKLSLNPVGTSFQVVTATGNPPPTSSTSDKFTEFKTVHDTLRNRWITVSSYPTPGQLYILPQDLSGWTNVPTTGPYPSANTWYVYDPGGDQIIGWTGSGAAVSGLPVDGDPRTTWRLRLSVSPLTWEKLANATAGDTVPAAFNYVEQAMVFDASRGRAFLTQNSGLGAWTTWAYYPPTTAVGTITSFPLPTSTGSTFGQNYYGAPFRTNGVCKHVEMAYCPLNNRLYACMGDTLFSNTNHMWSMDMVTGQWRFEAGFDRRLYSADAWPYPIPNGFQDEFLFQWVPSRAKFVIGFGCSDSYTTETTQAGSYAKGVWFFDPVTSVTSPQTAFTQDLSLFNTFEYRGNNPAINDQCYDENTDTVYQIVDTVVKRWHVGTMTQLSSISLGSTWYYLPTTQPYSISIRNATIIVDGWLYALGTRTNGVGSVSPFFCRFNLTTNAIQVLTPPTRPSAVPTWPINTLETRIAKSGSKIVFPVTTGPEGPIYTILVYNPATDTWTEDTQQPSYGSFVANSITSLPDGRVAMCGANTSPMTHIWFYKAN